MNEPGIQQPPRFRLARLFWVGVVVFAMGSGPLLLVLLFTALGLTRDPNPNPIGLGFMAGLTFWPSVALVVGGLAASISKYRKARREFDDRKAQ
jgi:hypothetical protein